jgi:hypothetical protein
MIPKPPSWMSTRMVPSPKPDQYVGVSTTTRPVTHAADVAVKTAVRNGAPPGALVATGSRSASVPRAMMPTKPATTYWAGWRSRSVR